MAILPNIIIGHSVKNGEEFKGVFIIIWERLNDNIGKYKRRNIHQENQMLDNEFLLVWIVDIVP